MPKLLRILVVALRGCLKPDADVEGQIARVRIGSRSFSPLLEGVLRIEIGPPPTEGVR